MKNDKNKIRDKKDNNKDDKDFPGYPHYSDGEDIYSQDKEETEIDPENPKKLKPKDHTEDFVEEIVVDETDLYMEISGADLDVPGAELDDEMEDIGSEDEENNYYSLGGDNHESDEEDKTQR